MYVVDLILKSQTGGKKLMSKIKTSANNEKDVLRKGELSGQLRGTNRAGRREERAKLTVPIGVKRKDLQRCPGCGGLVKMPCLLCQLEG